MRKPSEQADNGAVILCVEDETDLLRDITEELSEAGYQALAAADGDAALTLLQERRPDLILCDISMPGRDGFELLAAVQAKGADYADIPFVFLTALSDPREVVEGKRLGADDYLVKPIDYDLLLATVEARLRQVKRIVDAQPAHGGQPDASMLHARFELTPAETRVAIALSQGKQPMEVADHLNITRTTVAFHMRNIYGKTGTNRQAELVTLLLTPANHGT